MALILFFCSTVHTGFLVLFMVQLCPQVCYVILLIQSYTIYSPDWRFNEMVSARYHTFRSVRVELKTSITYIGNGSIDEGLQSSDCCAG